MKKPCCYIILLFLAVGLSSCVKDVVLDAKEEPLLSVYCVLTQDSIQTLKLSFTKGASQTEAPRVTEASAVLTDLTENSEAGRFARTSESDWQLEYAAIPGHNYRLEVTVPGRETVWAEQTMPKEVPVKSVAFAPWLPGYDPLPGYEGWLLFGTQYCSTFPCAVWAYAKNYNASSGQHEFAKDICTTFSYVDNGNLTGRVRAKMDVEDLDDPEKYQYILSGFPYHNKILRFPKCDYQTPVYFAIDGDFRGQYYHYYFDQPQPSPTQGVLYFSALSEEYDQWLYEAYQRYYAEQSSDLSSIYLRDNMYTNIHGGLGVFGAILTVPQRWERPHKTRIDPPDENDPNIRPA